MKEQFAFYAMPGDDGFPRVGHFIVGQQPENAIEVTEGHAAQLSAELRAREEKREPKEQVNTDYVTRSEAAEMAIEAAKAAVANFAAEIAKSAGGGNAN